MKILITLLLALFISSQAYAQSSTEVVSKGKILSMHAGESDAIYYIVLYKKELFHCEINRDEVLCYKPVNLDIIEQY
tara:strand:- start:157 stop:387 length:231 start_codon:yes stop_codon:yes gene_type:complete